jgi:hypothetical protein
MVQRCGSAVQRRAKMGRRKRKLKKKKKKKEKKKLASVVLA